MANIDWTSLSCRLENIFNIIPRPSLARLHVCKALLALAAENDEIDTLQFSSSDVDRWLGEWNASPEEKSSFLKSVADTFSSVDRPYVHLEDISFKG